MRHVIKYKCTIKESVHFNPTLNKHQFSDTVVDRFVGDNKPLGPFTLQLFTQYTCIEVHTTLNYSLISATQSILFYANVQMQNYCAVAVNIVEVSLLQWVLPEPDFAMRTHRLTSKILPATLLELLNV